MPVDQKPLYEDLRYGDETPDDTLARFVRWYRASQARVRMYENLSWWNHFLALLGFHECATCYRWRGSGGELCRRCRREIHRDMKAAAAGKNAS